MAPGLALALALTFNGHTWPYDTAFLSTMPGASITFEAAPPDDGKDRRADNGKVAKYRLRAERGTAVQKAPRKWIWTAPDQPGTYTLKFDGPGRTTEVQVFVLVPARQIRNGFLNGYRIGPYPPARGRYTPPVGFIEVTKENDDVKVSPHFRLKQFLCRQEPIDQYPKYLALQEELVLKLEAVLARVNALGFKADTLHVMSGYRTPFYNRAIGDVQYSMHQWGSAADIYVDTLHHDRMDDLTRDGRVDIDDARLLYDEIDRMPWLASRGLPEGGLGFYPATSAHPPFVHVDARGTKARWRG